MSETGKKSLKFNENMKTLVFIVSDSYIIDKKDFYVNNVFVIKILNHCFSLIKLLLIMFCKGI